jgi:membrane protease YdiL (CAAX protease family)
MTDAERIPEARLTDEGRRVVAALSPIGLIALCRAAQYLAAPALGVWAWLPTMILFWAAIGALISWFGGSGSIERWLKPAQGAWAWRLVALAMGLLSLPGFLSHWTVVRPPTILFLWLAFSLLNPWFEEGYWRGLLLDATERWSGFFSVTWSAVWFAVSHPLIWGVQSVPMRQWVVVPVLTVIGIVWALAYRRSRSLRWSIAGHMCANLFGLAVPVLLNLYLPYDR